MVTALRKNSLQTLCIKGTLVCRWHFLRNKKKYENKISTANGWTRKPQRTFRNKLNVGEKK